MTKQEEFLWIVQTAVLANGLNLATNADTRGMYREVYSSTGVRITMREAVRASGLIPETMEAGDAADEFCLYMFKNHRDMLEHNDELRVVPTWFARS